MGLEDFSLGQDEEMGWVRLRMMRNREFGRLEMGSPQNLFFRRDDGDKAWELRIS